MKSVYTTNQLIELLGSGTIREDVKEDSKFVVCSYWWGRGIYNPKSNHSMKYEEQAERLIDQLYNLKVSYCTLEVFQFTEKDVPLKICLATRGLFIRLMMERYPGKTIVYVDSDLQIISYPSLFEIDADFFCVNLFNFDEECFSPFQVDFPSNIMAFGNTFNGTVLLDLLNTAAIKNLDHYPDKVYSSLISRHYLTEETRCVWLPETYLFVSSNKNPSFVNTLETDLAVTEYSREDIVFYHEDSEESIMRALSKNGMTMNKNAFRSLGAKLRCQETTFLNYLDYGLTEEQTRQCRFDFKTKQDLEIFANTTIKPITASDIIHNENLIRDVLINKRSDTEPQGSLPVILSIMDFNLNGDTIVSEFASELEHYGFEYCIIDSEDPDRINKATLIYHFMEITSKNIVYMDSACNLKRFPDLFKTKSMDFMTINMNNTNIDLPHCHDPRTLRTINDCLYFFANQPIVKQFLCIWNQFNVDPEYQHKALEYAFNVSMSVNKLRCYWLPKDYFNGTVITFEKDQEDVFYDDTYSNKVQHQFLKEIQQCGIKGSLGKDGAPNKTHWSGSRYKREVDTFSKHFIQY